MEDLKTFVPAFPQNNAAQRADKGADMLYNEMDYQ